MVERWGTSQLVKIKGKDETALRRYLLGDAPSSEREEIELWLMSGEEAYELLEAAEDDLIDDSLAGRLTGRDLTRFNDHFLAAPERQLKLQFSRSFRRVVAASTQPILELPTRAASSFGGRLFDAIRYRPAFVYAGSALILFMLMGGAWSLVRVAGLQQELQSTTVQLIDAGRAHDNLKRQLDESQAAARTLEAQLVELKSTASAKVAQVPSLALTLMPGTLRSAGPQNALPQIRLTPNPSLVEFSLILLDDNFTLYRASLVDADRGEILSYNRLAVSTAATEKAVVLTVPAQILPAGDYSLILSGIPDRGSPETVGRYDFRAVRQ